MSSALQLVYQKHDVAYMLFHYLWQVSAKNIYFISEQEITELGYPCSDDAAENEDELNSMRSTVLTIPAICKLLDKGATIRFNNHYELPAMYRLIKEHIENWENIAITQIDALIPPVEDFYLLVELANLIAPYAICFNAQVLPSDPVYELLLNLQAQNGLFAFERRDDVNMFNSAQTNNTARIPVLVVPEILHGAFQ